MLLGDANPQRGRVVGRDSACSGQHFQLLPSDFLIIPPDLPTAGGGTEEWETHGCSAGDGLRADKLLEGVSPGDSL